MEIEFDDVLERVDGHPFWLSYFSDATRPASRIGIHLSIFAESILSRVLSGEKTIESRLSRNRCAPYGEIGDGDIILLKEVAGPICGLALARRSWCYDLAIEPIEPIEPIERIWLRFGAGIGASDDFWTAHEDAFYATLIELEAPTAIKAVACHKRDRRGWVALPPRQMTFAFA